jgi:hypothetical protein
MQVHVREKRVRPGAMIDAGTPVRASEGMLPIRT